MYSGAGVDLDGATDGDAVDFRTGAALGVGAREGTGAVAGAGGGEYAGARGAT